MPFCSAALGRQFSRRNNGLQRPSTRPDAHPLHISTLQTWISASLHMAFTFQIARRDKARSIHARRMIGQDPISVAAWAQQPAPGPLQRLALLCGWCATRFVSPVEASAARKLCAPAMDKSELFLKPLSQRQQEITRVTELPFFSPSGFLLFGVLLRLKNVTESGVSWYQNTMLPRLGRPRPYVYFSKRIFYFLFDLIEARCAPSFSSNDLRNRSPHVAIVITSASSRP